MLGRLDAGTLPLRRTRHDLAGMALGACLCVAGSVGVAATALLRRATGHGQLSG